MKDVHLHFTGSLSPSYVYKRLKETAHPFLISHGISSPDTLSGTFRSLFTSDYNINQNIFNDIYSLIQSVTKPNSDTDVYDVYRVGTYELALHLFKMGITNYTIIAGAAGNIDNTYARYLGMIHGFADAEKLCKKLYGQICITFIRDGGGKLKNYSYNLLKDICRLLQTEPFKSRCVGFDISGYEYPDENLLNSNLHVLEEIIETKKTYGLGTTVGLHAGEIITNTVCDSLYDDYFIKLSQLHPDNIGHGTYLWSEPKRQKILKLFAKNTRFDICPVSNSLLTPVNNISSGIQNLKTCGVAYTLNRDDPLIFNNWHQR